MHFVIDRAKWRCGAYGKHQHGIGPTYMLNTAGYMCCLGQICQQLGCERSHLINCDGPANVACRIHDGAAMNILLYKSKFQNLFFTADGRISGFTHTMMQINDDSLLTDNRREDELKQVCIEYGHTIEFIGEFDKE